MDELILLVLGAIFNGVMLATGMLIGTRLTTKSMIKEVEKMLEKSETAQSVKKLVTDQTLIQKATQFFEEATALVSSNEAKNFFRNVTELMKDLGGESEVKLKLPKRKDVHLPEAADYEGEWEEI